MSIHEGWPVAGRMLAEFGTTRPPQSDIRDATIIDRAQADNLDVPMLDIREL